ncbi:MAG: 50S ribosomal protein L1, partial [Deltaproteobacteria bacterium]|nr:50S ribosomal protein L1 [Deltaproteobacteria bacterium]
EKAGIIHAPVGKVSFAADMLKGNLLALVEALVKAKPSAAKGTYIKKISLSSTMGAGVNLDISDVTAQI